MIGNVCEYDVDEFAEVRPDDGDGVMVFGVIHREGDDLFIRGSRASIAIDRTHDDDVPAGVLERMIGKRGRAVGYYRDTPGCGVIEALSIGTVGIQHER